MIHPPTPTLAFVISTREVALPLLNARVLPPTQQTPMDPRAQGYWTGEALECLGEWTRPKTTWTTDQFNQPIEAAETKAPSVKIEAEAIAEADAAVPLGLSYVRVHVPARAFTASPFPRRLASPVPTPLPTPTRLDDGERHGVVANQIVADLAAKPPPPLRQDEHETAQILNQVR